MTPLDLRGVRELDLAKLRETWERATRIDENRDALLVAVGNMTYAARQRQADIGELACAVPQLLALVEELRAARDEACEIALGWVQGGHNAATETRRRIQELRAIGQRAEGDVK